MDVTSFVLGLIYSYVGILMVLLLQTPFRTLGRDSVGFALLGAVFWPVSVWPALLMWWWQQRHSRREEWLD